MFILVQSIQTHIVIAIRYLCGHNLKQTPKQKYVCAENSPFTTGPHTVLPIPAPSFHNWIHQPSMIYDVDINQRTYRRPYTHWSCLNCIWRNGARTPQCHQNWRKTWKRESECETIMHCSRLISPVSQNDFFGICALCHKCYWKTEENKKYRTIVVLCITRSDHWRSAERLWCFR